MAEKTREEMFEERALTRIQWKKELYFNCTEEELEQLIYEDTIFRTAASSAQAYFHTDRLTLCEIVLRWKRGGDVSAELVHPDKNIRQAAKLWLEKIK